jgi:hypothetical protein
LLWEAVYDGTSMRFGYVSGFPVHNRALIQDFYCRLRCASRLAADRVTSTGPFPDNSRNAAYTAFRAGPEVTVEYQLNVITFV